MITPMDAAPYMHTLAMGHLTPNGHRHRSTSSISGNKFPAWRQMFARILIEQASNPKVAWTLDVPIQGIATISFPVNRFAPVSLCGRPSNVPVPLAPA